MTAPRDRTTVRFSNGYSLLDHAHAVATAWVFDRLGLRELSS